MYAIIEDGGKQYRVNTGDTLYLELKASTVTGDEITFDKVLCVSTDKGLTVGSPYVKGASVKASVVKNGKSKKIHVFKYNPKKNYRRRQGHRQPYTKVTIGEIIA